MGNKVVSSEKYNKSQTKIIDQFVLYLETLLGEIDPSDSQYPEILKLKNFIKKTEGLCFGFSNIHAFVHLPENIKINLPEWWDETLFWISQSDVQKNSLENLILFENSKSPKSLRQIFDSAINDIVYYQMQAVEGHPLLEYSNQYTMQERFSGLLPKVATPTQPDSKQNADSLDLKDKKLKTRKNIIQKGIVTIETLHGIAGYFSKESLIDNLQDEAIKDNLSSNNICILLSNKHACSLRFDKDKNLWFFHDPNYDEFDCDGENNIEICHQEKSFSSIEKLADEILRILGNNIRCWIGQLKFADQSFQPLATSPAPFGHYLGSLENTPMLYLQKGGMATLLSGGMDGSAPFICKFLQESKNLPPEFINHPENMSGNTALMGASMWDHEQVMDLLLEKKADIAIFNKDRIGAFSYAIQNNNENYLNKLFPKTDLDKKHQYKGTGKTPVMDAILYSSTNIVTFLLDHKLDVNLSDERGWTALMYAAMDVRKNNLEKVNLLIKHGANLDYQAEDGTTALMLAVKNNQTAIVSELINKGATINLQDKESHSALYFAQESGNSEIIGLLSPGKKPQDEKISDAKFKPKPLLLDKNQLLIETVKNNSVAAVEKLLEENETTDLLARDMEGKTALMHAVIKGDLEIVRVLLDCSPLWNQFLLPAKDKNENTALFYAVQTGREDLVNFLLNLSGTAKADTRALEAAIKRCDQPIINCLIAAGVSIGKINLADTLKQSAGEPISPISKDLLPQIRATGLLVKEPYIHPQRLSIVFNLALAAPEKNAGIIKQIFHLAANDPCAVNKILTTMKASLENGELNELDDRNIKFILAEEVVKGGKVEVVDLLYKEIGISLDIGINKKNQTVLGLAAECGHEDIVKWALNEGATIDVLDSENLSPFMRALGNNHDHIVLQLLRAELQNYDKLDFVNISSKFQSIFDLGKSKIITELFRLSMTMDDQETAKIMLYIIYTLSSQNKISKDLFEDMKKEFAETAVSWEREDTVKLLLKIMPPNTIINNENQTTLSLAASCGYKGIVELALDSGANISGKFYKNRPLPLALAQENGHDDIAALLNERAAKNENSNSVSEQTNTMVLESKLGSTKENIAGTFSFKDKTTITFLPSSVSDNQSSSSINLDPVASLDGSAKKFENL